MNANPNCLQLIALPFENLGHIIDDGHPPQVISNALWTTVWKHFPEGAQDSSSKVSGALEVVASTGLSVALSSV